MSGFFESLIGAAEQFAGDISGRGCEPDEEEVQKAFEKADKDLKEKNLRDQIFSIILIAGMFILLTSPSALGIAQNFASQIGFKLSEGDALLQVRILNGIFFGLLVMGYLRVTKKGIVNYSELNEDMTKVLKNVAMAACPVPV